MMNNYKLILFLFIVATFSASSLHAKAVVQPKGQPSKERILKVMETTKGQQLLDKIAKLPKSHIKYLDSLVYADEKTLDSIDKKILKKIDADVKLESMLNKLMNRHQGSGW